MPNSTHGFCCCAAGGPAWNHSTSCAAQALSRLKTETLVMYRCRPSFRLRQRWCRVGRVGGGAPLHSWRESGQEFHADASARLRRQMQPGSQTRWARVELLTRSLGVHRPCAAAGGIPQLHVPLIPSRKQRGARALCAQPGSSSSSSARHVGSGALWHRPARTRTRLAPQHAARSTPHRTAWRSSRRQVRQPQTSEWGPGLT